MTDDELYQEAEDRLVEAAKTLDSLADDLTTGIATDAITSVLPHLYELIESRLPQGDASIYTRRRMHCLITDIITDVITAQTAQVVSRSDVPKKRRPRKL